MCLFKMFRWIIGVHAATILPGAVDVIEAKSQSLLYMKPSAAQSFASPPQPVEFLSSQQNFTSCAERTITMDQKVSRRKTPLRLIPIGSNSRTVPPAISDAFDSITWLCADSSGRGACDPFNPLRHGESVSLTLPLDPGRLGSKGTKWLT
jgi:hypothetical protein